MTMPQLAFGTPVLDSKRIHVPVHAHKQHPSHERSKNLREYIMGNLSPGKTLPNSEANRNGWIEVPTGSRSTGDDSKSNTDSETPTDLEDAAEGCRIRLLSVYVEGSDGCYAGETDHCQSLGSVLIRNNPLHIEEDSSSFCHALPQPTRPYFVSVCFGQCGIEAY